MATKDRKRVGLRLVFFISGSFIWVQQKRGIRAFLLMTVNQVLDRNANSRSKKARACCNRPKPLES